MPDFAALKERQQQMWAAGDFSMIGVGQIIVSELLCEAVDLRPGQQVLDVATGSGNTALAAACRNCDVMGVDYVPTLLEHIHRFNQSGDETMVVPGEYLEVVATPREARGTLEGEYRRLLGQKRNVSVDGGIVKDVVPFFR